MTAPKVCLVMIVKDEAAIIRERLEAVVGEIDCWVIVDTGSAEGTPEIVENVMREHEKPGRLAYLKWLGFADARTTAVRMAAEEFPGAWALLLDADTIFHPDRIWRSALVEGVDGLSCAVEHGSIRYWHPRVLRLGEHYEWRWRGVLHEYLEIPPGRRVVETTLLSVEHGSGGARSKDPKRFENDAHTLALAMAEIRGDTSDPGHPDRDLLPRYKFHLAQSWGDAGESMLALAAYLERTQMAGGYWEEVVISWLRIGELRWGRGDSTGAVSAWLRAWAADPSRAEPLIGLAMIHREQHLWAPAYGFAWQAFCAAYSGKPRGMFGDVNVQWRADFELGVAGWYTDHMHEGRRACERVLESDLAPEAFKVTAKANLELYP